MNHTKFSIEKEVFWLEALGAKLNKAPWGSSFFKIDQSTNMVISVLNQVFAKTEGLRNFSIHIFYRQAFDKVLVQQDEKAVI